MDEFKSRIVLLILGGQPEEALVLLSERYGVRTPELKVGLPKGHKTVAYGCYTSKTETISVLNSDLLSNPFVILHEFYHHLRSRNVDKIHKGTEKNANKFALDFLKMWTALKNTTPERLTLQRGFLYSLIYRKKVSILCLGIVVLWGPRIQICLVGLWMGLGLRRRMRIRLP